MVKVAIIIFEKNTIYQQRSDYKSGLLVDNSYMLSTSKNKLSGDTTVKPLLDLVGTADGIFPGRNSYNYQISPDAGISNVGDPRWY